MRMTITMKVISVFSIIPQDRSDQIKMYLRTVYSNNNVFIVLSFLSFSNSPVLVCVGYIKQRPCQRPSLHHYRDSQHEGCPRTLRLHRRLSCHGLPRARPGHVSRHGHQVSQTEYVLPSPMVQLSTFTNGDFSCFMCNYSGPKHQ